MPHQDAKDPGRLAFVESNQSTIDSENKKVRLFLAVCSRAVQARVLLLLVEYSYPLHSKLVKGNPLLIIWNGGSVAGASAGSILTVKNLWPPKETGTKEGSSWFRTAGDGRVCQNVEE